MDCPNEEGSTTKEFNILIAVTGSVAAIKVIELVHHLTELPYIPRSDRQKVKIRVVQTENSKHFVTKSDLVEELGDKLDLAFDDQDEWSSWSGMGDPVLHIELRKWADLMLIVPLDANTMAKLANGICDNLLTCIVRAWDISKPLYYCPAMNVHMYSHPLTKTHLDILDSLGYKRIDCIEKKLACGDVGLGGMATVHSIVHEVTEHIIKALDSET